MVATRLRRRLAIVSVLALVLGGVWAGRSPRRGWTVDKVQRLIRAEVPPGCDRGAAESWFDRHGIRHFWFDDVTGDRRGGRTMPDMAGLRSDQLLGMLRGDIEGADADVDWLFPGRIGVYFFFDRQGRRVGEVVDPLVYMP